MKNSLLNVWQLHLENGCYDDDDNDDDDDDDDKADDSDDTNLNH